MLTGEAVTFSKCSESAGVSGELIQDLDTCRLIEQGQIPTNKSIRRLFKKISYFFRLSLH